MDTFKALRIHDSGGRASARIESIGLDDPADPAPLGESLGLRTIVGGFAVLLVLLGLAFGPLANALGKMAVIRG